LSVPRSSRSLLFAALVLIAALFGGGAGQLLGACGPFADVPADGFCSLVLEIFTLGITTGTTPTTYEPTSEVSRLQMAAFLSRTVDGVLKRGTQRLPMRHLWTATDSTFLQTTSLDTDEPQMVEFDGADLWVGEPQTARLGRVRASDGKLLETWTGVLDYPGGILIAMGRVFVVTNGLDSGLTGKLYRIDPTLAAGAATTVASNLPRNAYGIAFDGAKIFITNLDGTMSLVTPGATVPWTVNNTAGGYQFPRGALFDGSNVWITDDTDFTNEGALIKLNSAGGVLQTITVGKVPTFPVFDGSNIWVPNQGDNTVTVVRASSGAVLATLTGNGLGFPYQAAFDGQRILITDFAPAAVSLFKAADLTPQGSVAMPANFNPYGATSDGVNFWITLNTGVTPFVGKLLRF
jgi:hypothetical protein